MSTPSDPDLPPPLSPPVEASEPGPGRPTSPEAAPQVTPDAALRAVPDATPQVTPEAALRAVPDAAPRAVPDAASRAVSDAAPQVTPEAALRAVPDAAPQVTPEAALRAVSDAAPQVTGDAALRAVPDAAMQAPSDIERPPVRTWPRTAAIAGVVAVAIAALGAPIGWLWAAVAPEVEMVKTQIGPYPIEPAPEGYVADDGWFVVIGGVAGVLFGILAWYLLRRHRGPLMLVALVAGSIGGAVIAAWLGNRVGLADFRRLVAEAPLGTRLFRPAQLRVSDVGLWYGFLPRVRGVVLVQAFAAAATYTAMAGFHAAPSLRDDDREPEYAGAPSWGWTEQPVPGAEPAPPAPAAAGSPPGAAPATPPAAD